MPDEDVLQSQLSELVVEAQAATAPQIVKPTSEQQGRALIADALSVFGGDSSRPFGQRILAAKALENRQNALLFQMQQDNRARKINVIRNQIGDIRETELFPIRKAGLKANVAASQASTARSKQGLLFDIDIHDLDMQIRRNTVSLMDEQNEHFRNLARHQQNLTDGSKITLEQIRHDARTADNLRFLRTKAERMKLQQSIASSKATQAIKEVHGEGGLERLAKLEAAREINEALADNQAFITSVEQNKAASEIARVQGEAAAYEGNDATLNFYKTTAVFGPAAANFNPAASAYQRYAGMSLLASQHSFGGTEPPAGNTPGGKIANANVFAIQAAVEKEKLTPFASGLVNVEMLALHNLGLDYEGNGVDVDRLNPIWSNDKQKHQYIEDVFERFTGKDTINFWAKSIKAVYPENIEAGIRKEVVFHTKRMSKHMKVENYQTVRSRNPPKAIRQITGGRFAGTLPAFAAQKPPTVAQDLKNLHFGIIKKLMQAMTDDLQTQQLISVLPPDLFGG